MHRPPAQASREADVGVPETAEILEDKASVDAYMEYITARPGMQLPDGQGQEAMLRWGRTLGPDAFINREMAWLQFNRRVLDEARCEENPLLERVKFLAITASNLDEFFMVRVAAARYRALRGDERQDAAGYTPWRVVAEAAAGARALMAEQMEVLTRHLQPALAAHGLALLPFGGLSAEQARWAEGIFAREILPQLVPFVEREDAAFPVVAGQALQLGLLLADEATGRERIATVQLPGGVPRTWRLPAALGEGFVRSEEIIARHAGQLAAPGMRVVGCWPYRVTRDEDYVVPNSAPEGALVAETKKSLRKRKTGAVVRLEVDAAADARFVARLCGALSVRLDAVYRVDGPLGLGFLPKMLAGMEGLDALKYPPFEGRVPGRLSGPGSIFDALRGGDVLLHHPYDSFASVLRFVTEAARDPRVLAINMTLYRVSGKSPVIRALAEAAEAGKRVTVLLELKARFDEESNIRWAGVLTRAGCDVIYGLPRVKTHSKIALVVRREAGALTRYVHLGTGNYNDVTARLYTDMGLLTADEALGADAQAFFNMITGFSREPVMRRLIYAPRMLRQSITALIEAEIAHARAGRPAGIMAKMNSLTDPGLIRLLYEASGAGVPVRLMVRGVCCLRPGVKGLSERIEVRSIVGRFLEHSRVFRFENGGAARLFLSSADWMPRNLNRRVELMFPVEDAEARAAVQRVLDVQWQDNVKAWTMAGDGRYVRRTPGAGEDGVRAQEALMGEGE